MITGAIKNKVDKIWTDIWAGGIANPLSFMKLFDMKKRSEIVEAINKVKSNATVVAM